MAADHVLFGSTCKDGPPPLLRDDPIRCWEGRDRFRSRALGGGALGWLCIVVGLPTGAPGCSSCRRSDQREHVQAVSVIEIPPGKRLDPWKFQELIRHDIALPVGCQLVSRPMRHAHPGVDLVFTAVQGETGSLAAVSIAPDRADPASRGIVSISPSNFAGEVRDIPWLVTSTPPQMAVSRGRWVAWLTQTETYSPAVRLWLWREGHVPALMAEGDGLSAVDSRCREDRCAVMTTRPAAVAMTGASLWQGAFESDPSQWQRIDVGTSELPLGARPLGISRYDDNSRPVILSFETASEVIFRSVYEGVVQEAGRVPRDDGVLDTGAMTFPFAVTVVGKPNADGCVTDPAVAIQTPERAAVVFRTSSLAISGFARPLTNGTLVTWIEPVTCRHPDRKVVSAVLLDAHGRPRSGVMAVKYADGFATATSGDDVHLWFMDAQGVTWVRANCRSI